MTRLALGIEYSGSAYCGWQRQAHSPSVQEQVEAALAFVANNPVELSCAGRTDSGVHAIEQVAHFDSDAPRSERSWLLGSNSRLPGDIRIKWVCPVPTDFHARFSAEARSYRYLIYNAKVPGAIFHNRVTWESYQLDASLMNSCAQMLLGEQDFSSFRAAGCQSSTPMRNLHSIEVKRLGNIVLVDIKANAFLYHMVRNIVGSLLAIGRKHKDADWFASVFDSRDRTLAETTAPASGLYLLKAHYPDHFNLPSDIEKPVLFES